MLICSAHCPFNMMASRQYSQAVIKNEIFDHWNTPQCQLLDSSLDEMNSYEESKHLFQSCNDIKTEEVSEGISLPEPLFPITFSTTLEVPAGSHCRNISTHHGLGKIQEITSLQTRPPHGLLMVKKLLQLSVPKKHECSRWTKHTTESIIKFLKSFVTFARGSSLTHCGDKSLALRGPRILKCEECFLEFSGLYDRYLKLFIHYKTSHRRKCNMLIGRKWIKQKVSFDIMVQAWKMDLKYDLYNGVCHSFQ